MIICKSLIILKLHNNFQNLMDTNPKVFLSDKNQMPLIGLGTLNFKPNDKTFNLNDFIMKAAQIGYTHFDLNPSATSAQQALGQAFRLVFQVKKQMQDQDGQKIPDQFIEAFPRQNMFFAYKVYNTADIQKNIKTALQNFKLQYFDLVMLNCPMSPPPAAPQQPAQGEPKDQQQKKQQQKIPVINAWKIMESCKEKNLCKSIGVSNFSSQVLCDLCPFTKYPPTVNQIQCHPFLLQKNLINVCKLLKIKIIAYCPLMHGGKDQKQPLGDKIDYNAEPILKEIAIKYAKSIPQIILNYQICRDVTVIPKTQKADHLNDNYNITDFQLIQEDIEKIQSLDKGGRLRTYQLKNLPLWKGQDPLC